MTEIRDTIAAIATPAGMSGIGVIRISGPDSQKIASALAQMKLKPRYAHFCNFQDEKNKTIDQGIAVFFRAPASFTGEDSLELFAHGGRTLLESLLDRVIELGARHARAGEFSERAFINGKIDLLQAEAIADLIESKSRKAAHSAMQSLQGKFSEEINEIKNRLMSLRVYCESCLDFPEEEIESRDIKECFNNLVACKDEISTLLRKAKTGKRIREGVKIVITGEPNVGKSSLMNCLTASDRSIVTSTPGTTRDIINEQVLLDDLHVELVDTAGIRETGNDIEREGVRRARKEAASADIILCMKDAGDEHTDVLDRVEADMEKLILVNNKIDLYGIEAGVQVNDSGVNKINLSAKTEQGVDLLIDVIKHRLGLENSGEDVLLARQRHIDALNRTQAQIDLAIKQSGSVSNMELTAEHLRLAQQQLDEIVGNTYTDDLLGEIFANFCIGK